MFFFNYLVRSICSTCRENETSLFFSVGNRRNVDRRRKRTSLQKNPRRNRKRTTTHRTLPRSAATFGSENLCREEFREKIFSFSAKEFRRFSPWRFVNKSTIRKRSSFSSSSNWDSSIRTTNPTTNKLSGSELFGAAAKSSCRTFLPARNNSSSKSRRNTKISSSNWWNSRRVAKPNSNKPSKTSAKNKRSFNETPKNVKFAPNIFIEIRSDFSFDELSVDLEETRRTAKRHRPTDKSAQKAALRRETPFPKSLWRENCSNQKIRGEISTRTEDQRGFSFSIDAEFSELSVDRRDEQVGNESSFNETESRIERREIHRTDRDKIARENWRPGKEKSRSWSISNVDSLRGKGTSVDALFAGSFVEFRSPLSHRGRRSSSRLEGNLLDVEFVSRLLAENFGPETKIRQSALVRFRSSTTIVFLLSRQKRDENSRLDRLPFDHRRLSRTVSFESFPLGVMSTIDLRCSNRLEELLLNRSVDRDNENLGRCSHHGGRRKHFCLSTMKRTFHFLVQSIFHFLVAIFQIKTERFFYPKTKISSASRLWHPCRPSESMYFSPRFPSSTGVAFRDKVRWLIDRLRTSLLIVLNAAIVSDNSSNLGYVCPQSLGIYRTTFSLRFIDASDSAA